eukprot:TRINITY_DN5198_c1_g1_i1.p1 TRINITY_DN5198_c1_g1~~TRINITY_DN5198_c1_g1_i1.p1  ORF type:complete len:292 (+),score=49.36 TRINITY_DN5198_c1_g1_i1:83-958(+)
MATLSTLIAMAPGPRDLLGSYFGLAELSRCGCADRSTMCALDDGKLLRTCLKQELPHVAVEDNAFFSEKTMRRNLLTCCGPLLRAPAPLGAPLKLGSLAQVQDLTFALQSALRQAKTHLQSGGGRVAKVIVGSFQLGRDALGETAAVHLSSTEAFQLAGLPDGTLQLQLGLKANSLMVKADFCARPASNKTAARLPLRVQATTPLCLNVASLTPDFSLAYRGARLLLDGSIQKSSNGIWALKHPESSFEPFGPDGVPCVLVVMDEGPCRRKGRLASALQLDRVRRLPRARA